MAEQIGISYSIATYFILKDRPDVASILSDIRPARSKYGRIKGHQTSKEGDSRMSVKDGSRSEKGTEGDHRSHEDMDGHRCGSKEINKSRDGERKRKQWVNSGSLKLKTMDPTPKQSSCDSGSESHRHQHSEGDMAYDDKQGTDDHYCGSEHSNSGSEDYKHSHSGKKGKQFGQSAWVIYCESFSDIANS